MKVLNDLVAVDVPENVELVWHDAGYKVIKFVNDVPVAFLNVEGVDNNEDIALDLARKLLSGGGLTL